MTDIIAQLEKDRSTNVIDLCQRHGQYTTFPAAWAVVAGNTKLKATSSSSRERCCSQLTFQIRGRPATLCLRNLQSAALEVQCGNARPELHWFTRSAECTRAETATSETFSDQVNQASDPMPPFSGSILALDSFPTDSITLTLSCSWLFGHLLSSEPIKVYLLSACGQQLRMKSKFF